MKVILNLLLFKQINCHNYTKTFSLARKESFVNLPSKKHYQFHFPNVYFCCILFYLKQSIAYKTITENALWFVYWLT